MTILLTGHRNQFRYSPISRQIALTRQSLLPVTLNKKGKVETGKWICSYTGTETNLVAALQGDHVVPLEWAWKNGADKWTIKKRKELANDQDNILIVLSTVNDEKGDSPPDTWLPPNTLFQEKYLQIFNNICEKYGLPLSTIVL
jgi:hypothetical protein